MRACRGVGLDEMPPSADHIAFTPVLRTAPAPAERLVPVVQRLVADVPLGARVLEVGCGTGLLARELATKRGARVTAIDVSPRSIDVARVRTPASLGVEYRVADFMELSPRGFDVVIATDVLHELSAGDALPRMADAVVPGGSLLIADVYRGWFADDSAPYAAVRRELRAALPGVAVRRHIWWRYTARWTRPGE